MRAVAIYEQLDSAFPPSERMPHHEHGFEFEAIYNATYEPMEFDPYDMEGITEADVQAELIAALDWLTMQGAWNAIAAAGAKPNAVRPIDARGGTLIDILLPELAIFRDLSRARLATLHLALQSGDESGAEQAVQDLFTLARASSHQAILIYVLMSDRIGTMLYDYVQQQIVLDRLAPDVVARLLALFNTNPPRSDVVLQFEGEHLSMLDLTQWFYSDDGDGDGTLLLAKLGPILASISAENGFTAMSWEQPDWHPITNLGGIGFASRAETTAKTNDLHHRMVRAASAPTVGSDIEVTMIANEVESLGNSFALLQMFLPALGKVVTTQNKVRMRHDGARIMLAIELYRAEHGNPPESLDDLVPEFLSELPADALSGKLFGYRVIESEDDPHNRAYLLYSIGLDGEDNRGAYDDFWPDRALTTPESGVDFVINKPPME